MLVPTILCQLQPVVWTGAAAPELYSLHYCQAGPSLVIDTCISYLTDTQAQVNERKIIWLGLLGPLPPASRQILAFTGQTLDLGNSGRRTSGLVRAVKVKFSPALLLISTVPLTVCQYPFICSNVWVRPLFWDKQFVQSHWHLRTGIPRPFSAI